MDKFSTFLTELADAVFGTLNDFNQGSAVAEESSPLVKENRMMYLILFFIFVLVIGNWMFERPGLVEI